MDASSLSTLTSAQTRDKRFLLLVAGLGGVVGPLYLAECLDAANGGKGTGIFQWLLTLGIVAAAVIGMYFSYRVDEVAKLGDAEQLVAFKDHAWRSIFWVSLPPGIVFVLGCFMVTESPRWLHRHDRTDAARAALQRSRSTAQAESELREMAQMLAAEKSQSSPGVRVHESLLHRKYLIPSLLACIILVCNQTAGINSIIGYSTNILIQDGLSDVQAHWGYVMLTLVNFLCTIGAVILVDRKGREFLLSLGSAGIVVCLIAVGLLFRKTEQYRLDCRDAVQALVTPDQRASLSFDRTSAARLLARSFPPGQGILPQDLSMVVIYSYGDFRASTAVMRTNDSHAKAITLTRDSCVPSNKVIAFFTNPFADLASARTAPLLIENALIAPLPDAQNGWLTAIAIFCFIAFFAVGSGVCVWLALSELMPTRIRSYGMSIALLFNQAVSTGIAAVFLPTVGRLGYSTMFFVFAGCTVFYFITAAFFLPETKGKTLEEIEAHFAGCAEIS